MLTDKERRIRWMNPAAVERTGYTLHSAESMLPSEILHLVQTEPEIVKELCNTLNSGHAIQRELRAQARDGTIYWLELNVQPLHDAIGAIEGYMVIGIDTTSHKQAEARLLQDRSLAMRASHEGIAIIRPNGRLSYANPALRRFLSIDPDAKLGALMWTDITPPNLTERMTRNPAGLVVRGRVGRRIHAQAAGWNDRTFQYFPVCRNRRLYACIDPRHHTPPPSRA